MNSAVLAAAISPLLTALLAALGFWLRDLRDRRNRDRAYRRAVKQAREQVTFIELAQHLSAGHFR
ncbi:MAG: hypothetical protein ACRDQ7_09875 [Haloechinothrix sp.]